MFLHIYHWFESSCSKIFCSPKETRKTCRHPQISPRMNSIPAFVLKKKFFWNSFPNFHVQTSFPVQFPVANYSEDPVHKKRIHEKTNWICFLSFEKIKYVLFLVFCDRIQSSLANRVYGSSLAGIVVTQGSNLVPTLSHQQFALF